MFITFLVITYNNSNYIISCLESIKNQLRLHNENLQLVITDDDSSDNTYSLIQEWIGRNKYIFSDVVLSKQKKNRGIVENYISGIDKCDGNIIKTIAGDDIIPNINIFKVFDFINYDVCFGLRLPFYDDSISYTRNDYLKYYIYNKSMKLFNHRITYVTHASSIYKKEILTKDVKRFLSKYKYLEDIPLLYWIIENYKFQITQTPLILYRIHHKSASKDKDSIILNEINKDYIHFYSYAKSISNNIFQRFFFMYKVSEYEIKSMSSSKRKYYYRYFDIFTYWIWFYKKYEMIFDNKIIEHNYHKLNEFIAQNDLYLKSIVHYDQ